MKRSSLIVLLGLAWVAVALALCVTRAPVSNEAWIAIPALNLARHGFLGTTVLEYRNTWLKGVDRHTYWQMPLDLVFQAAWFKLLGFSLFRQRILSVIFALVLLAAWARIVLRLTGDATAALLTPLVIGFEWNFLSGAANGRMDMACASLGAMGIASWLEWKQTHPMRAMCLSHVLCAASLFSHPCGVLFAASLIALQLFNRSFRAPLSWRALAPAIAPYLGGAALWGLYISAAPGDFRSQFFGNSSGFAGEYLRRGRFNGLVNPVLAFRDEIELRYLAGLKRYWIVLSLLASAAAIAVPQIRRRAGVRALLALEFLVFLMMTFFEGMKFPQYLLYPLPFIAAVTSAAASFLWDKGGWRRCAAALGIALLTAPQVLSLVNGVIRPNPLRNRVGSVAEYIQTRALPGDRVIGGAELGYFLGFDGMLRDDVRLGYSSGLRPRFIATPGWYELWRRASETRDPGVYAYTTHLLRDNYHCILTRGDYRLYETNIPVRSETETNKTTDAFSANAR